MSFVVEQSHLCLLFSSMQLTFTSSAFEDGKVLQPENCLGCGTQDCITKARRLLCLKINGDPPGIRMTTKNKICISMF